MRILLLNERRSEREAMVRALPRESFEVQAVNDEFAALSAISGDAPQLLLVSAPAKGGPELIRRLAGADASGQMYVVVLLESVPSGKELAHYFTCGVHDVIRRPLIDAELLERVKGPTRTLRWARSVTKPALFDFGTGVDLTQLSAWKNLGSLVAGDLAQVAGQSFSMSKGRIHSLAGECLSATIPMSLAGDQLELRVSVVADSPCLSWLRETLLGDAGAPLEAAKDALRELANTAAGAFKRAALKENVVLTTGLPVSNPTFDCNFDHPSWSLKVEGYPATLLVIAEVREHRNLRVPASKLTEGMVLAHDIRNEAGILLVPAGSRLTTTSALKLSQVLGPRFFLEVAPAS